MHLCKNIRNLIRVSAFCWSSMLAHFQQTHSKLWMFSDHDRWTDWTGRARHLPMLALGRSKQSVIICRLIVLCMFSSHGRLLSSIISGCESLTPIRPGGPSRRA